MSATDFYKLKVSQVIDETPEAKTFVFEIPQDQLDTFKARAGQYVTIRTVIKGQEERRAYSMSSAPVLNEPLAVTVKRVPRGKVSNWLFESVKPGHEIDVMPPQGRFVAQPETQKQRAFYLIGAGSGITPLMSITKTILEAEPMSRVFLLYGSRNEEQIIFYKQFETLQTRYRHQLFVEHVLSQPAKQRAGGVAGWFKKPDSAWKGSFGRIDRTKILQFLDEHPTDTTENNFYLCGPGDLITLAESVLAEQGVAEKAIHKEYFTLPDTPAANASVNSGAFQVNVVKDGRSITVPVDGKQTILQALIANKHDVPYSCMSGACSTCMAKVTRGRVRMDSALSLEKDEIAAGYILTCQAHPETADVAITFDE
jgi:ring-1,2-phenylacetyl-CoA epoxidase subunit PaaE